MPSNEDQARLNSIVAIQLNFLKLNMEPKAKSFDIGVRSLALHFLTESEEDSFTDWRLQGRQSATHKCSTSQQELQKRGFVPVLALTDFTTVFKNMQMAVKLNQISMSFAEDSIQDFVAFLRLVQVSVTDDLVRLEDELTDQAALLGDSQDPANQTLLLTYHGTQKKSELSLIHERSMVHEDSVCINARDLSQNQISASSRSDEDASMVFGEGSPFK